MKINFSKTKIDPKELLSKAKYFLVRRSQWIIAVIAALFLFYCAYLWYSYITNPQWSAVKRQEYVDTKESEVVFDQKKFDSVISEIGKRKSEYGQSENAPDIFRLK